MRAFLLVATSLSLAFVCACNPSSSASEGPSDEEICTNISQYEHEFTSDVEESCSGFIAEVRSECGQAMIDCFATAASGAAVDACEDLCE